MIGWLFKFRPKYLTYTVFTILIIKSIVLDVFNQRQVFGIE